MKKFLNILLVLFVSLFSYFAVKAATSENFVLEKIEPISFNEVKLYFNSNLEEGDSAIREFIISNTKDSLDELKVVNTVIDAGDKSIVNLTFGTDALPWTEYELVVIDLKDEKWRNIESWIDWLGFFVMPNAFNKAWNVSPTINTWKNGTSLDTWNGTSVSTKDGKTSVTTANGTSLTTWLDGTNLTTWNGTNVSTKDGKTSVTTADGSVNVSADGSADIDLNSAANVSVWKNADGSDIVAWKNADGSDIVAWSVDENGNIVTWQNVDENSIEKNTLSESGKISALPKTGAWHIFILVLSFVLASLIFVFKVKKYN